MKALGYSVPSVSRELQSPWRWGVSLCFTSEDQAVVTFVTREATTGLPQRGQPSNSLPFRLHALFVDTASGAVRATREWPTAWRWSWIARAPGRKFLVITPDELVLYSDDLDPIKHLKLPITKEAIEDAWRVEPSAQGNNIVVEYEPRGDDATGQEIRRMWVDGATLNILGMWTEKGLQSGNSMTISDGGTALLGYQIGKPGGPYHRLCLPSHAQPWCGLLTLLSDRVVFSLKFPGAGVGGLSLISTGGDVLSQQDFLPKEVYGRLAISAHGQRFAICLDKIEGAIPALDIGGHTRVSRVNVYDLSEHSWVYTIDGKEQELKSISALALSPDGSMLALIDQDGFLLLYHLPQSGMSK